MTETSERAGLSGRWLMSAARHPRTTLDDRANKTANSPSLLAGCRAAIELLRKHLHTHMVRANRTLVVWSLSPQGEMNRFVSRSKFDTAAATELYS